MAKKILVVEDLMIKDRLACQIAEKYITWESSRQRRVEEWKEIQAYVYATDTTQTSNSALPWSNKTTIPKLCQIRDNLYANYMAALFPRRKSIQWVPDNEDSDNPDKRNAIESYMFWVTDRNEFYNTVSRLVYDYIDYGNCFAMPEWFDGRNLTDNKQQHGFVGPLLRRISPLDIVFDPTADHFTQTPKVIRSFVSLGEIKELLSRQSVTEEDKAFGSELYNYLKEQRNIARDTTYNVTTKDDMFRIAGFDSWVSYLSSNTVEVLTFYGDIYDEENDKLLRNQIIKVVDRHKIMYMDDNPSYLGHAPVFHVGWRQRPDNLWAMGPLDNIVGMQYRIDHLENMKADVFDLIAYPPIMIKGDVEDFTWGPFEKIYVDSDGTVELMSPNVQALQADTQIAILENKMEEMAGSPREAMGFRTPGEKTAYEVQSIENAYGRIFQSKISQFERDGVEQWLNSMLELARRNITSETIRIFDTQNKINDFLTLSADDLTGYGRIRPVAARHFAEQSRVVQNLTAFFQSGPGQDPAINVHFSGQKVAYMLEDLLDLQDYNLVEPFVRLTEQADAQRINNVNQEQTLVESQTSGGLNPDDFDQDVLAGA